MAVIITVGAQISEAGTFKIYLNDSSSSPKPYVLMKGSDVNLINVYDSKITNIIVVNITSEKRVLKIDELPMGQSIQVGFDNVGSYQLIYKISAENFEDIYKRLLIKVVNASSA